MKALALALILLVPLVPATSAAPDGCPEEHIVVGEHERHTVTVQDDCSVDIVLGEGIVCIGGNVEREESEIGPVHITRYHCTWPTPTPVEPDVKHHDVFVPETVACTWTGSYKPVVDTPVVTVWVYSCDPQT